MLCRRSPALLHTKGFKTQKSSSFACSSSYALAAPWPRSDYAVGEPCWRDAPRGNLLTAWEHIYLPLQLQPQMLLYAVLSPFRGSGSPAATAGRHTQDEAGKASRSRAACPAS